MEWLWILHRQHIRSTAKSHTHECMQVVYRAVSMWDARGMGACGMDGTQVLCICSGCAVDVLWMCRGCAVDVHHPNLTKILKSMSTPPPPPLQWEWQTSS